MKHKPIGMTSLLCGVRAGYRVKKLDFQDQGKLNFHNMLNKSSPEEGTMKCLGGVKSSESEGSLSLKGSDHHWQKPGWRRGIIYTLEEICFQWPTYREQQEVKVAY